MADPVGFNPTASTKEWLHQIKMSIFIMYMDQVRHCLSLETTCSMAADTRCRGYRNLMVIGLRPQ